MKCLVACFGKLKHREKQKPIQRFNLNELVNEKCEAAEVINKSRNEVLQPEEVITSLALSDDEIEGQLIPSSRKKVTSDSDLDLESSDSFPARGAENEEEEEKGNKEENKHEVDLTRSSSSLISYPLNHSGHHDSTGPDDDEKEEKEFEDIELNDSDLQGSDDDDCVQEESSDSLLSISLDSKKQVHPAAEMCGGDKEKEVSSPLRPCDNEMKPEEIIISPRERDKEVRRTLKPCDREVKLEEIISLRERDRSQCVDNSVLNSVENLTRYEAVKSKTARVMNHGGKENINAGQESVLPFSEEAKGRDKTGAKQSDAAVDDTSLSSWLVESEKPSGSVSNSPDSVKLSKRVQDRVVLGELTGVEIKQLSASS